MATTTRLTGIIFSDLGRASSFMALDWVQAALRAALGFDCFPATLNVRPKEEQDARLWQALRTQSAGVALPPSDGGHCGARLYPVEICIGGGTASEKVSGAVLLPEVNGYPNDKIEIVAAVRLKDAFGVKDGDSLTLEFFH